MIAVDIFNKDIVDFRRQLVAALNTETARVDTLDEDHTATKTIVVNQGADLTALQTEVDAVEVEVNTLQTHEANWVNRDGTVPLTADWDAGAHEVTMNSVVLSVSTGTAPIAVNSITKVNNLNVDRLDGAHVGTSGAAIPLLNATNTWSAQQTFGVIKSAGHLRAVSTKTTAYVMTAADEVVICNSATAFTITLIAASGSGRVYAIKNINTGVVTIDGDSSDTIDGAASVNIIQWEAVQLVDYAANKWVII